MSAVLTILLAAIVGGLALGAFSEWLKYRSRLGIPPEQYRELQKDLQLLKNENERLRRRIENLETIVSSADWDRLFAQEEGPLSMPVSKEAEEQPERLRRRER